MSIRKWDDEVNAAATNVTKLRTDLDTVHRHQEHLSTKLDSISAQQADLEQVLANLENTVALCRDRQNLSEDEKRREETYKLAQTVDSYLHGMDDTVKDILAVLNSSAEQFDPLNPMGKILKVLNAHTTTLQWIDAESSKLDQCIAQAQQNLRTRDVYMQRRFPQ